jgi:hypothetical protein
VQNAFVNGYASANGKNKHRDHQGIKVELFTVAEWVLRIGGPLAALNSEQKQPTVPGIDERMNAFRQHRRAAGDSGSHEFRRGYREVSGDSGVNRCF